MATAYIPRGGGGTVVPVPLRPSQISNWKPGFETGLSRWQNSHQPPKAWPACTYFRSKLNITISVAVRTSKRKQTGSITKVSQLILFVDTRLFMSTHTKRINTLCQQNFASINVTAGVQIRDFFSAAPSMAAVSHGQPTIAGTSRDSCLACLRQR
jgi:hypothetical protein